MANIKIVLLAIPIVMLGNFPPMVMAQESLDESQRPCPNKTHQLRDGSCTLLCLDDEYYNLDLKRCINCPLNATNHEKNSASKCFPKIDPNDEVRIPNDEEESTKESSTVNEKLSKSVAISTDPTAHKETSTSVLPQTTRIQHNFNTTVSPPSGNASNVPQVKPTDLTIAKKQTEERNVWRDFLIIMSVIAALAIVFGFTLRNWHHNRMRVKLSEV